LKHKFFFARVASIKKYEARTCQDIRTHSGTESVMKLVGEYLIDAIKFVQMAEDAKDEELKAALMKQAADYRKLALKRAGQLGIPLPAVSPETKRDEI
jgi:hypothetical protein